MSDVDEYGFVKPPYRDLIFNHGERMESLTITHRHGGKIGLSYSDILLLLPFMVNQPEFRVLLAEAKREYLKGD